MKRYLQQKRQLRRKRNAGFSLVELLIAMIVLAIGLLGGMIVILTAIASNARNRFDTAAVALAQSTMDRIIVLSSSAAVQQTQLTDCDGDGPAPNGVHLINTNVGGAPLVDIANVGNGAQSIDFSQAAVPGYQMLYKLCATGAADGLATGNPQIYDIRWNVSAPIGGATGSTQLVLVAAKSANEAGNGDRRQTQFFSLPVTLRGIRGN